MFRAGRASEARTGRGGSRGTRRESRVAELTLTRGCSDQCEGSMEESYACIRGRRQRATFHHQRSGRYTSRSAFSPKAFVAHTCNITTSIRLALTVNRRILSLITLRHSNNSRRSSVYSRTRCKLIIIRRGYTSKPLHTSQSTPARVNTLLPNPSTAHPHPPTSPESYIPLKSKNLNHKVQFTLNTLYTFNNKL